MAGVMSRDYLSFLIVRIIGVGTKPLALLVAGITLQDQFAKDYAVLITAVASLFVLTGAQTHIDYYNRRFADDKIAYTNAYKGYFRASFLQFLVSWPFVALLALAWSTDPILILSSLLIIGFEKFFDEDQRHFLYTKEYIGWCWSFSFRVILPTLAIIAVLPFAEGRLVVLYTAFCFTSFIAYALVRRHYFVIYWRIIRDLFRDLIRHFGVVVGSFLKRWKNEYSFNQVWTFLSVNILLADRLWASNMRSDSFDHYVFFASLFNIVNVGHSLLYFTRRRPEIIRKESVSGFSEITKAGNLVTPIALLCICLLGAFLTRHLIPTYQDVPPLLLCSFGAVFYVQAVSLVGVEFTFWRVSRRWLVLVDSLLIAVCLGLLFVVNPAIELAPLFTVGALTLRLLIYQYLLSRPRFKAVRNS